MTMPNVSLDERPDVSAFLDAQSNTTSYVIKDPDSTSCAIIDAVMQFDYATGRLSYESADEIIDFITSNGLHLEWIIGTHVHAGHLSAPPYIQGRLGGKIGIGEYIQEVQDTFGKVFNEGTEFQRDGSQFDKLFKDGDLYKIGSLECFAIHSPGPHTCMHGTCNG
jgi:glyoxylase-like metal-dependent hydrolase (beta-lactamase superfamily II)